ncbi:MAG: UDP-glucose 4-epimerase [Bacteroidetes bacterium HGW-Bacteroidetes-17]|jgi:UDP-glucose 4-epimerase|nr:MAG: UDP-glucose 4-epimerase [Bacteroidetes bacterium HGW-Bacteroidetes-17]
MSLCFVTGVAGFIGSSVAERLLSEGFSVIGIDSFTNYYSIAQKKSNLNQLQKNKEFSFYELDLVKSDFAKLLTKVEYVFHFAAQPGVRDGFGENFIHYLNSNILATQKLLEAVKNLPVKKFVFASSSSIYGQYSSKEVSEDAVPQPISLYGSSKHMAENICRIYFANYHVPTIIFRLFTVYGPRQRPDMSFNKFFSSILNNKKVVVFGNGNQTRDFTYINDVVDANILALKSNAVGEVFNIGSGSSITLKDSLKILQNISGQNFNIEYIPKELGEGEHTLANISKAKTILNYSPKWNLHDGLTEEFHWLKTR